MMVALFFMGLLTSNAIGCKSEDACKTFNCGKKGTRENPRKKSKNKKTKSSESQNNLKDASKEKTESKVYLFDTVKEYISKETIKNIPTKLKNVANYPLPAWVTAAGTAAGAVGGVGVTIAGFLLIKTEA